MKTWFGLAAMAALMAAAACDNGGNNSTPPADCPEGTFGCPCLPDDTCGERDGAQLVCFNAVCAEDNTPDPNPSMDPQPSPDPQPGMDPEPGPDPGPDPMPMEGLGLFVDSADARACEAVIIDPDKKIAEITFPDTIEGRSQRRGARLAVAFSAKADEAIAANPAIFTLADGVTDIDGITAERARCFDRLGAVLDGVTATPEDKR